MRGKAADRPASVSGASAFTRRRIRFGGVETPAHDLSARYAGSVSGAGARITLRLATAADAQAIAEIYNREVTRSTATFDIVPRTIEQQREWLAARSGAFAAVVAIDDSRRVVGFASLSPYKERAAYRTTVEDSVYVHPDHTGQGIGKVLLGRLVETDGGQRGADENAAEPVKKGAHRLDRIDEANIRDPVGDNVQRHTRPISHP